MKRFVQRMVSLSFSGVMGLSLLFSVNTALAQTPQILGYQGRVTVDGTNFNGTAQFKFSLVSGDASQTFWSNGVSTVSVPVSKGAYSVLLGDSGMTPVSSSVFTNSDVRLRIWFDDGINGSQLLSPDQRIGAVGYAMAADRLSMTIGGTSWDIDVQTLIPPPVDENDMANSLVISENGNPVAIFGDEALSCVFDIYTTAEISCEGQMCVGGQLSVDGDISCLGEKCFVQAHPTDPTKDIYYTCLEGPEAGTYMRGKAELVNGEAVIVLPDHFGMVTSPDGLTVQLTPRGTWLQLYVVNATVSEITVREATGQNGEFDYFVQGVRLGYENNPVIRDRLK